MTFASIAIHPKKLLQLMQVATKNSLAAAANAGSDIPKLVSMLQSTPKGMKPNPCKIQDLQDIPTPNRRSNYIHS